MKSKSTWPRKTTSMAWTVVFSFAFAAAQHAPLIKNGACPQLTRSAAAWLNTAEARGRFITNNSGTFTLKSNPGTMQDPLAPQQSINCSQVPAGLRAEMWSSELEAGNMKSLQAFTFDERGRMWAVETFDYPNNVTNPFSGNDRIVILEDTDGDHVADKETVFATGLNIPQGIEIVPQGVVIAMAPYLVLFTDADGDDKADVAQGTIIYQGFSKGDTHGANNSLKYGLDNWLYGDCGYNGGNVSGVNFGSGMWRVRLDTTKFEYIGPTTGGNSSGFGMMEDGQIFASAATGGGNTHSQHGVIPGVTSRLISAYGNSFKPLTLDIVQGDQFGGFTAATGHEFYTARLFPQKYWRNAAFVTDGTGHLVNVDFLTSSGSTWNATRDTTMPNIFASTDAWTAPIFTKVGPDGALWVLDWYTYVYLHNGMASQFQGAGAAWINPLRTRTQERLYRLVPDDNRLDPVLDLRNASYAQLVATFQNTNMFWRSMAQKLILRKATTPTAKAQVESLLVIALRSRQKDAIGLDGYALHALWTAQGLGLFTANPTKWDPILKGLLLHPSQAVRMNVPRAMPRSAASIQAIKDQCVVNDDDAYVRLWTLIGMSQQPALSGINMWSTYHNLDTWSQQAFTKAVAGSGVTDVGTKPCAPALDAVSAIKTGVAFPSRGLRFAATRDGWKILPDGLLRPGQLVLFDLKGSVVDRISYDGREWSGHLKAARSPVYLYVYRTADGATSGGKLLRSVSP